MTLGLGNSLQDQFAALERDALADAELSRRRGFGRKIA
jgi:hypothetical protein